MEVLEQILQQVIAQLKEHATKIAIALATMVVGWYFGKRRATADWQKREFYELINFSLNMVHDGKLVIRTLVEKRCAEVFLNSVACDTIIAAAKQTTVADPIIPLSADDYWYYLNYLLNELSEQFNVGFLLQDQGVKVKSAIYVVALTREADIGVRSQKLRAMIVRKEVLEQMYKQQQVQLTKGEAADVALQVVSDKHQTRVKTLNFLAREFQAKPSRFIEVELAANPERTV